jgi:hypothetical protein
LIRKFFAITISTMKKNSKRKQGRPRKAPEKVKGELLQIRMTTAEKQAFANAAELAGHDLSVWVRDQLRRAARQVFAEFGRSDPFLSGKSPDGS